MELCKGTLETLVCCEGEGFAAENLSHLEVLSQITTGIDYLHQLGVVHGNLKPSNILVSYPRGALQLPIVKLTDFGLLRRVKGNVIAQFETAFTEGWMCPFDSRDPVASSFDVFPLGCLFGFTVSNGTHPFGTDPITAISNRHQMTLTLDEMASGVQSTELLNLIKRMLYYEADQRPSTYEVFTFVLRLSSSTSNGSYKELIKLDLSNVLILKICL